MTLELHRPPRATRPDSSRGVALVIVLLVLATTTVVGIGALTAALSDLRITSNQNCYNRTLSTSESGFDDALAEIQAIPELQFAQRASLRVNTTNNSYTTEPLSFWNFKNCGDLNDSSQATDAAALCATSNASLAATDGELQDATGVGGAFDYYFEYRLLNREVGPGLIAGETIGSVQSYPLLVHTLGTGCGIASDVKARVTRSIRVLGAGNMGFGGVYGDVPIGAAG